MLRPGDVVRLKSGGPNMTVTPVGPMGQSQVANPVRCQWFDGDDLQDNIFEEACLDQIITTA